ncbi:hypothetical protein BA92_14515 [Sanguibacteroides justesenii]|uniref:Uncharacterized protein n=1 Tax=Sanguibacteroides justesenii TaxID=1547597 RepID=A0A0C3R1J1_9PORP|nr:hypothetical protein BA92_14515 [Sanguibacteroides justesenii]
MLCSATIIGKQEPFTLPVFIVLFSFLKNIFNRKNQKKQHPNVKFLKRVVPNKGRRILYMKKNILFCHKKQGFIYME